MTPWLAMLKKPKILVISVISIAFVSYYGWSEVKQSRLETRVAELEGTITAKDSEIKSLVSSVGVQNSAVQEWKAKAQSRTEAAHKAQREAQAAREQAAERIGELRARNAQTCEEGIELIDEVLGL